MEIFWSPFTLLLVFVPLGVASDALEWGDGWTFVLNFIVAASTGVSNKYDPLLGGSFSGNGLDALFVDFYLFFPLLVLC